jgi:nitric oxide reductase NorQ protein
MTIGTDGMAVPFYAATGNEVALFEHAHRNRLPVLLKGPTGCGKTRFVAHMAAKLGRPLHTVSCHDDLTAADLTGRHLLKGGDTVWVDGPLTRATSPATCRCASWSTCRCRPTATWRTAACSTSRRRRCWF